MGFTHVEAPFPKGAFKLFTAFYKHKELAYNSPLCLAELNHNQYMKNLVIVESPAKAKTIEKYLGSDFKVLSSVGHIH